MHLLPAANSPTPALVDHERVVSLVSRDVKPGPGPDQEEELFPVPVPGSQMKLCLAHRVLPIQHCASVQQ